LNTPDSWADKINDPPKMVAMSVGENPFDIFGINTSFTFYIESKLQKRYEAFNFNAIRPHQRANLTTISDIAKRGKYNNVYPLIVLGIWLPRKPIELYIFHIDFINKKIEEGKKSILKKEIEEIKKEKKVLIMNKKEFSIEDFQSKIIGVDYVN